MSKPLVTVGVPCYNYGRYLDFCLQSLFAQTYQNLQVIVVDDHSSDNTPKVVKKNAGKITSVRHRVNQGNVATYNHAIELARGKYFTLLSADDGLLPTCIEKSVAILENYPQVGLVYTATKIIDAKNRVVRTTDPRQKLSYVGDPDDFKVLLTGWNFVPTPGAVVRTEIFDELGGYDAKFPHPNDWDMWLKISSRYQLAYFGASEPQAYYRLHKSNSHFDMEKTGRAANDILQLYAKWFNDKSVPQNIRNLKNQTLFNFHLAFVGKYAYNRKYSRALAEILKALFISPEEIFSPKLYTAFLGLLGRIGRDTLRDYLPLRSGGFSRR